MSWPVIVNGGSGALRECNTCHRVMPTLDDNGVRIFYGDKLASLGRLMAMCKACHYRSTAKTCAICGRYRKKGVCPGTDHGATPALTAAVVRVMIANFGYEAVLSPVFDWFLRGSGRQGSRVAKAVEVRRLERAVLRESQFVLDAAERIEMWEGRRQGHQILLERDLRSLLEMGEKPRTRVSDLGLVITGFVPR